jgi:hypothetical protein
LTLFMSETCPDGKLSYSVKFIAAQEKIYIESIGYHLADGGLTICLAGLAAALFEFEHLRRDYIRMSCAME